MDQGLILMESGRMALTIERMALQVLERVKVGEAVCIIAMQPRGIILAERIHSHLTQLSPSTPLRFGILDITFFRDDVRKPGRPLQPHTTKMDFIIEDAHVFLIDDVLYTGRTIQAAFAALQPFGRPSCLDLVALIDRRFNRHLPIQANVVGMRVDSLDDAYVRVEWRETHEEDRVLLFADRKNL